ncbi:cholecystokinin receptor type A-like [Saccostrea echinata]|uniref:cholecystokinin receptor type A-like n=1 Tax=Saccostrea echinata TaxID=191078 RepID=UPI002A827BD0|nr:cholecystokinin receptor type A-like [Saccostrea echinata]
MNNSNFSEINNSSEHLPHEALSSEVAAVCYAVIFVLALLGNSLVIATLVQNKRMRTVTNVFLLNLAISDLLLALFCMPFNIIPMLMRNFVFGPTFCYLSRYFQGVSVGVSSFTLVAISLERYFAICRPLQSRKWQTLSHAYRSILLIWGMAFVIMIPIPVHTKHENRRPGMYTCREKWVADIAERIYTVALVLLLLVIPLIAMSVAYGTVTHTLYEDITVQKGTNGFYRRRNSGSMQSLENSSFRNFLGSRGGGLNSGDSTPQKKTEQRCMIRHSNPERSRAAKVRVIRMLLAVVIEYLICWTPLYVVQTWNSFHSQSLKEYFSNLTLSLVFMLAYISSACNPVTYCLMNKKFRQSFRSVLSCCNCCSLPNVSRHFSNRSDQFNSLKLQTTRCSLLKNHHQELTQEQV